MKLYEIVPTEDIEYPIAHVVWVIADNEEEAKKIVVDDFHGWGYELGKLKFEVDTVKDISKGIVGAQYSCDCDGWR